MWRHFLYVVTSVFFSRANCKILNFELENLHEDEIFEKQDTLHF